jgi:hypothetical protein
MLLGAMIVHTRSVVQMIGKACSDVVEGPIANSLPVDL